MQADASDEMCMHGEPLTSLLIVKSARVTTLQLVAAAELFGRHVIEHGSAALMSVALISINCTLICGCSMQNSFSSDIKEMMQTVRVFCLCTLICEPHMWADERRWPWWHLGCAAPRQSHHPEAIRFFRHATLSARFPNKTCEDV